MASYPIEKKQLLMSSSHTPSGNFSPIPPSLLGVLFQFPSWVTKGTKDTELNFPSSRALSFLHFTDCVYSLSKDWIFVIWASAFWWCLFDSGCGVEIVLKNMKRAAVNLKQFNARDVQANAKIKHQTLLNEYLELQKDFVSKKRKFQAAKQKRDSLLAIVKFLRRKQQFLLKCQTSTTESERNLVHCQNARSMLEKEIKHAAHEATMRREEGGRRIAQHEQFLREESKRLKVQEVNLLMTKQ